MSSILFIGGPLHGQIHDMQQVGQTTYVCEVPRKVDFIYSADPSDPLRLPAEMFKTDRFYYEINYEFEDFVFTLRGATDEEIDHEYLAWRNAQEALFA